ncbi:MAG: ribonuclease HII [Rubrivivax sp.]|nr:ribonuclease HII [Rubrivivax sp.]
MPSRSSSAPRSARKVRKGRLPRLKLVLEPPGLVAGVDEAGRGPLAGPVVAAAVILDDARPIRGLDDSKVLTAKKRERLHDLIRAQALCVAVGQANVEEIDRLNILQATLLAMQRAVAGLRLPPRHVLVDGNRAPEFARPLLSVRAIVDGDARVAAISAASIIAKVTRDRLCDELHARWPGYGFDAHKGYATAVHLKALRTLGPCPDHRRSFAPVREACGAAPVTPPPWPDDDAAGAGAGE